MIVYSPISGNKAQFEQTILVTDLVKKYEQTFNINVSQYFGTNRNISVYKCVDTGYRFFYPLTINGDSVFYEHFQKYDWYYMPWKWEHEKALDYIKKGMSVLEIGCAKGDFLSKVQKKNGCTCVGIEYNESIKECGKQQEVLIYNESILEFSQKHKEEFDVVCSFQVLEHISNVREFIESQLTCLKKGGLFIVSVPNNKSFLRYAFADNILNLPPHHMGLWDKYSLKSLKNYFPIKKKVLLYEPIQSYHKNWHESVLKNRIVEIKENRILSVVYRILPNFVTTRIDYWGFRLLFNRNQKGHSIMIVFEKC